METVYLVASFLCPLVMGFAFGYYSGRRAELRKFKDHSENYYKPLARKPKRDYYKGPVS